MSSAIDVQQMRQQFPVTQRLLYLDAAHQTPLCAQVRAALADFYTEGYEAAGPKPLWLARAERTRARVAALLNASPTEVAFTKNTSEGLNIAAHAVPLAPGDEVLLLEGDHPNNAYAWLHQRRRGATVRFVRLRGEDDIADASTFLPHITGRTKVISLSHISFHAGQRHDIDSIGRLCRELGLYLVLDATQSIGVVPLDVRAANVSVLAASTHKGLLVPQGLGLLYVQAGLHELQPTYLALSSMAHPPADFIARPHDMDTRRDAGRFEIGNLNLPALHALDAALTLIDSVGVARIEHHVQTLGDRLIEHLDALRIPLVGPRARAHRAHIYTLSLPAAQWLDALARQQVRVSPERDGVRVSFALFNSSEDVDRLALLLRQPCADTRV